MTRTGKYVRQTAVVLAILALWQIATATGAWSAFILPSPQVVWDTFLGLLESGDLLDNVLISTRRVFVGFSISFVLAFALGMAAGLHPSLTVYYDHVLEFLRHIPPLALIPMLILWFGIGETSRIIIIVLTMFFPVYMNVKKGFASCDPHLLEVGRVLGFSNRKLYQRILLPNALPSILIGARVGMGFAWRAIIAAEMIAAASGLGWMIWHARAMSRSAVVIVGILTIGTVGVIFDRVFSLAIKRVLKGGVDDSWS